MRRAAVAFAALIIVISLVPGAAASSVSRSDPAGDVVTWAALFAPTSLCKDPAIDLRFTSVASDGPVLTIQQRVQDATAIGRCGGVPMPFEVRSSSVWLHGTMLPSIVASYQQSLYGGTVTTTAQCYQVGNTPRVCGEAAGFMTGNTAVWVVPLPVALQGRTYQEVFGSGQAETFFGTSTALMMADFNDLPSFTV